MTLPANGIRPGVTAGEPFVAVFSAKYGDKLAWSVWRPTGGCQELQIRCQKKHEGHLCEVMSLLAGIADGS